MEVLKQNRPSLYRSYNDGGMGGMGGSNILQIVIDIHKQDILDNASDAYLVIMSLFLTPKDSKACNISFIAVLQVSRSNRSQICK